MLSVASRASDGIGNPKVSGCSIESDVEGLLIGPNVRACGEQILALDDRSDVGLLWTVVAVLKMCGELS